MQNSLTGLPKASTVSKTPARLLASPSCSASQRDAFLISRSAAVVRTPAPRFVPQRLNMSTSAVSAEAAPAVGSSKSPVAVSQIGLVGLAVMGQNLALNVADKGFSISVYNRSHDKTEAAVKRAQKEGLGEKLTGYAEVQDFIMSLQKPRRVIILVKAGAPVDQTIVQLSKYMEAGDIIIDGGNEWYENTQRRKEEVAKKGLLYLGMGVSGGEEGARRGPSMMPGGSAEAYTHIKDIVEKVAAQVDDGPCVMYIGDGGSGNYVKMVHNGIEYGDMQLISEAYDILKTVGGLSNEELAAVFSAWNKSELASFLVEITAIIMAKKDEQAEGFLVDKIVDQTGSKGTGKWTVQQAADLGVAAPTITASLDGRYMSSNKPERVAAAEVFSKLGLQQPTTVPGVSKEQLVADVSAALYASKICSYAQGLNIIKAKSEEQKWGIDLGGLARIWKGGCIIRAQFLDEISKAYKRNPSLPNLLVDSEFAANIAQRDAAWRRVVSLSINAGVPVPGFSASLSYFDTYRRARLPANLVQAQRDFFGSHTYQRTDKEGWYHTVWDETFGSADSITTSSYIA
ncbi:6-phosphogluconate dehydrogenase, decarboxylating [Haematococcus lacustris]